jgi:hypothetical protein
MLLTIHSRQEGTVAEHQPLVESTLTEQDGADIAPAASPPPSPAPTTKRQGVAIIVMLAATLIIGLVLAFFAVTNRYDQQTSALVQKLVSPKYEYKTLEVYGKTSNRTGGGAFKFNSITPSHSQLSDLGAQGWAVVGTYLEMETAWPNFGSSKYVAGIQPNVRPQRLVLVLQRRVQ